MNLTLTLLFRVDYVEMQRHIEFDIDSDGTVSMEEARVSQVRRTGVVLNASDVVPVMELSVWKR